MLHKKSKNIFYTCLWILFLIASGGIVYYLERFGLFTREGQPIAEIIELQGDVRYRPEEISTWYKAFSNQEFYEFDRITTGEKSTAKIKLSAGQEVLIDENSQIQISKSRDEHDTSVIGVTLFKGYVSAEASEKAPLLIKSKEGKEFKLKNKGDSICLSKEDGNQTNIACLKTNNVVKIVPTHEVKVLKHEEIVHHEIVPNFLEIPTEVKEPQVTKEVEKKVPEVEINAEEYLPLVDTRLKKNNVVWTFGVLNEKSFKMEYSFSLKKKSTPGNTVTPFLELFDASNRQKKVVVKGNHLLTSQLINISVSELRQLIPDLHNRYQIVVGVRSGVEVKNVGKKTLKSAFNNDVMLYTIKNLEKISDEHIEVGLDGLQDSTDQKNWFFANDELPLGRQKIQITLNKKEDIKKIFSYLKNNKFYLRQGSVKNKKNVFIARDKEIIAAIDGIMNKDEAVLIKNKLNADFVFEGTQSSFFQSRGKSQQEFLGWMENIKTKRKVVYALKGKKFYPVSKEFLLRGQVTEFIGNNSTYVFDNKVKILDMDVEE